MRASIEVAGWLAAGALLGTLCAAAYVTQPVFAPIEPWRGARAQPERLRAHVEMLAGQLAPRTAAKPANLETAAIYIANDFRSLGLSVAEQPVEYKGDRFANVVTSFGPRTAERIVIGAHYDAASPGPGADDDASGVAGLLELARLLRSSQPALRVELVAFALEEDGLLGSEVHVRSLRDSGAQVRAMLSLEMIGYFRDEPGSQSYPLSGLRLLYPERGDFIAVVGRLGEAWLVRRTKAAMLGASPLEVRSITAPRFLPGVTLSDHASYWDAGYPAVMITDTAFFRNPNYHAAGDLPETLDYERMAQVVDGVHAAVLALAED